MTVREIGFLVWGHYRSRLNTYERSLLKKLLEGIAGLGEVSDHDLSDYLTSAQMAWVRRLGKRFHLK